jgi:hypothetical protein
MAEPERWQYDIICLFPVIDVGQAAQVFHCQDDAVGVNQGKHIRTITMQQIPVPCQPGVPFRKCIYYPPRQLLFDQLP